MTDPRTRDTSARKTRLLVGAVGAVGLFGAIGAAAMLTNIMDRKAEAATPFYRVVELNDTIEDPAIWGKNYPIQYEDYLKTEEMIPTKYGGSYAVPREPTEDDPRTFTAHSKIEKDPRMARMWSGMPFSADFREERGHRYNFLDQQLTKRQTEFKQPGTCLNCHASSYVTTLRLGDGDFVKGFEKMGTMSFDDAATHIKHPVTCIDCHNPQTMELRITRPGLIEGMRALKASEGIADYDVNKQASRQEMRTLVCAQCHVEYYFKGDEKRLVFPWHKGLTADSMYSYYTEVGFNDWKHKLTGASMIKAQHPEYEMFMQGTHAKAGVTCADCHMPMKRVGAMKVSDHHVRSPLLNINRACQTCHKASETELLARVESIQDRHHEMVSRALDALMALIDDLERIQKAEGETPRVLSARELHRRASWYVDYVEAENSTGFHAPQEAARLLQMSVDYARQGQLALSGGTTRSTTVIKLEDMRNPPNKGPNVVTPPAVAPAPAATQTSAPAAPAAPAARSGSTRR
jgi:nitrite reductase (cytochrome c-552)